MSRHCRAPVCGYQDSLSLLFTISFYSDCRYTCHTKCLSEVELDCPKAPSAVKSLEELTKETLEILVSERDLYGLA